MSIFWTIIHAYLVTPGPSEGCAHTAGRQRQHQIAGKDGAVKDFQQTAPDDGGQWKFWASFATTLRGHIVYGIDVRQVREEVGDKGYALRALKRMLRAS